jgi:rhodanese-related sulfurtransferase
MPNVAQLVAQATSHIENLDPAQTARELADGALVVDIREAHERHAIGAIPGTINVPRGLLEFNADPAHPAHIADFDPQRRTILYCASGGRSALATLALQQLGYDNVAHLDGGITAWTAAGRSIAAD